MAVPETSHNSLFAEVLTKHWRINEPALRTLLGVSRATWRVGPLYWLSQAESMRAAELFQQSTLLFALGRSLKSEHFSISVPKMSRLTAGVL